MLKKVRKRRNIILVLMAAILVFGVYIYMNFLQKDLIEVETVAIDNFGYTENEQVTLEAKKLDTDLYEIQLPQNINTKEVNKVTNVTLESRSDTTQENINVEVLDNKIQLTKEQLKNYKINLDVEYNAVLKQKQEDGTFETINLVEKTEEEIQKLEITDETEVLYEKILKHEEQNNDSMIELEGKMPENTELHVEKVSKERIKEIFGDIPIEVAYDIKILKDGTTEINPQDFEEIFEVTIKEAEISKYAQVYHVKEDDTYEYAKVTGATEGNISFEAQSFSIYAVGSVSTDDEIIEDEGTDTGAINVQCRFSWTTSAGNSGSFAAYDDGQYLTISVPEGGWVKFTNKTNYSGSVLCVASGGGNCQNNHASSHTLYAGYYGIYAYASASHTNGSYGAKVTIKETVPPKISVSPSSCSWRNSGLSVRITATEGDYSFSSPSYQYYVSTSSTELKGGSWTTYTSGSSFTLKPATTGTYYLFVKRIKDTQGNYSSSSSATSTTTVSSIRVHLYGSYNFDYINPTAGTMTMKLRKLQRR